MLAIACALGSALLYAAASVVQQRSAAAQGHEHSLRIGLLTRLLANPAWVLGIVADVGAYGLQFVALWKGALVVVQPLLVCGLLFALPLGAWWAGNRLSAKDWMSALGVCAGLGVFLVVADPGAGRDNTTPVAWAIILGAGLLGALGLAGAGRRRKGRHRAVFLSAGAGLVYGVAAALTKTTASLLANGIIPLLIHWQPYALVVAGAGGLLLGQSAFQAGALDSSLPTMSVVDPVASILIGAFAFGEQIRTGVVASTTEVLAVAGMVVGIWLLARVNARARELQHPPA